MNNGLLNIDRILAGRSFTRIAKRVDLVRSTTSTNDHIWAAAGDDPTDGHVLFAEFQSAGRGRMGRTWHSPTAASVMFSVLLIDTPDMPTPPADALGLITGIAAVTAINDATGVTAQIDWPNDIVVGRRKLGGVLIESRAIASGCRPSAISRQPLASSLRSPVSSLPFCRPHAVGCRAYAVGIGVNCLQHPHHFPHEIRARATSLDLASTRPVDRDRVAAALLVSLDAWFSQPARWVPSCLKAAFLEHATPLGRDIEVVSNGHTYAGQVIDIDPSAALVLQLHDGTRRLFPATTTIAASPR